MRKKTIRDIDVKGKRVLVRVDFNVPQTDNGEIEDDSRIRACLPTIQYLQEKGARIILCSHLGRPKGKIVENLRLAIVAERLSSLLGKKVPCLTDCIGPEVLSAVSSLHNSDIVLLENLRFYPEEEKNDPVFASELAKSADIFVNDAFGACHRSHASVVGITTFLPACAGLLLEKELEMLGGLLEHPDHPFAAIVGGAKVSGKLGVLDNILQKVDILFVGGGMAATFLAASGYSTGISPVEKDRIEYVRNLFQKAGESGVRIYLPLDVQVTAKSDGSSGSRIVDIEAIPDDMAIVDIGPETISTYIHALGSCKTIFWNGPMGLYEIPGFSQGTRKIADCLATSHAVTVIGGGSTSAIVAGFGYTDRMNFVSTGGGASLQFLAGETLPGIAALPDK